MLKVRDRTSSLSSCQFEDKKSKNPFCRMFYNIPIIVVEMTLSGDITYSNHSIYDVTGYDPLELLGKNWWDIFFPGDRKTDGVTLRQAIAEEDRFKIEMEVIRKDGSKATLLWNSTIAQDSEEGLINVIAYAIDISPRIKIEKHLQEERNKLQNYLDIAGILLMVLDNEANIKSINKKGCEMLNCNIKDAVGKNWIEEFVPEDAKAESRKIFNELITDKSNAPNNCENDVISKTGERKTLLYHCTPIKENGKITGILSSGEDITYIKKAEENIKNERNFYEKIMETLVIGIIINSPDGKVLFANKEAEKIFNTSRNKLEGISAKNPLWRFTDCYGNPINDENQILNKVINTKKPLLEECRHVVSPQGKVSTLSVNTIPLLDEKENVSVIVSSVIDITEREKARAELQKSEERFKKFSEAAVEGIVIHDKGKIIDANSAFFKMFGYKADEVYNKLNVLDFFAEESRPTVKHNVDSHFEEPYEAEGKRKDGSAFPAQIIGKMIPYQDRIVRVASVIDLTTRKVIENQLRKEKDLLMNIRATLPIGSFQVDKNWNIIYANNYALKVLNLTAEEILSKKYKASDWNAEDIDGNKLPDEKLPLTIARNTRKPVFNYIHTIYTKDGKKLTISVNAAPVFDEKGNFDSLIAAFEDITERIETEKKLKKLNEELKDKSSQLAQSNADLERFASVASHDLREPLSVITGYARLIERRCAQKIDPDDKRYLKYIIDEASRMQQLINGILKISKVSTKESEFKHIDLNNILKNVLIMLKDKIQSLNAEITTDEMPVLYVDEIQIGEVFQNLISNALKFHGNETPKIRISAKKEGDEWIFSVSDNGIGIDISQTDKIFEFFNIINRNGYTGTGIGLAITKKIISRHGGRIWFDSTPGKGTTFYFTIPAMHKLPNSGNDDDNTDPKEYQTGWSGFVI